MVNVNVILTTEISIHRVVRS